MFELFSGKPRPPIFSEDQREILSSVKELNITWSTDSIVPITQYLLAYRKSQVTDIMSLHLYLIYIFICLAFTPLYTSFESKLTIRLYQPPGN